MTRCSLLLGLCVCLALALAACTDSPATVAPKEDTATVADGLPGDGTATTTDAITDTGVFDHYTGACSGGPTVCDDGNPCTLDDCDPLQGCSNLVKGCADDDACTLDSCDVSTGNCVHKADPCEDDNPCTTGTCVAGEGCTFTIQDCGDGDACTSDGCSKQGGGCQNLPLDCDDGQTCTTDSCDPTQGCVHDKPEGAKCCESPADCDDGNPCTVHTCTAGICSSEGVFGCCAQDSDCGDQDACTADTCNKANGQCLNKLQAGPGCCSVDAECDDKTACTLDKCVGNSCSHEVTCCSQAKDCGAVDLCGTPTCTSVGCSVLPLDGAGCCQPDVMQTGFEDGDTWIPALAPASNGQWTLDSATGQAKTGKTALTYKEKLDGPIPGGGTVATVRFPEVTLPIGRAATLSFQVKSLIKSGAQWRLRAFTSAGTWIVWQGTNTGLSWQKVALNLTGLAARSATHKVRLQFEMLPGPNASGTVILDDVTILSTCQAQACTVNSQCNDNLTATAEVCVGGTCVYSPEPEYCEPATAKCDDGKTCTNDLCSNLKCLHIAIANCCTQTSDCGDKNVCTTDACDLNQCSHVKLPVSKCCNLDAECDDKNLCTVDACPAVGLGCTHTQTDANCCTSATDCNDADGCTLDSCSATHQCVHQNQCCTTVADCDDGDPICTTDTCVAGKCAWLPVDSTLCCQPDVLALDFEDGKLPGTLTLQNGPTAVKWQVVTNKKAHGGKGALYYGNLATGNFDDGNANTGTVKLGTLVVPAGDTTELSFWVWMDTEGGTYDDLTLLVDAPGGANKNVWQKSQVGLQLQQWVQVKVNLTQFAGQTVALRWLFNTVDSIGNSTEGVYLDDLSVKRTCQPVP